MRLFAFAAIAALGVSQVAAAPLRVIITTITPTGQPPSSFRLGHAVPLQPEVARVTLMKESVPTFMPCAGRARLDRFKEKAIEISNKFRLAIGLPLIELHGSDVKFQKLNIHHGHHHHHHEHHKHHKHEDHQLEEDEPEDPQDPPKEPPGSPGHHHHHHHKHHKHHHHHHHHGHHHHHKGKTFFGRIHSSLMSLGRWEGRAVAFVLGCGIGVLLRMVWVLTVLAFRSMRGNRDETEYIPVIGEYIPISLAGAPPTYTDYVDEKADASKKPAEEEQTK